MSERASAGWCRPQAHAAEATVEGPRKKGAQQSIYEASEHQVLHLFAFRAGRSIGKMKARSASFCIQRQPRRKPDRTLIGETKLLDQRTGRPAAGACSLQRLVYSMRAGTHYRSALTCPPHPAHFHHQFS